MMKSDNMVKAIKEDWGMTPYEKSKENMSIFYSDEIEMCKLGRYSKVPKTVRQLLVKYKLIKKPRSLGGRAESKPKKQKVKTPVSDSAPAWLAKWQKKPATPKPVKPRVRRVVKQENALKPCKFCGTTFMPSRISHMYCCKDCQREARASEVALCSKGDMRFAILAQP